MGRSSKRKLRKSTAEMVTTRVEVVKPFVPPQAEILVWEGLNNWRGPFSAASTSNEGMCYLLPNSLKKSMRQRTSPSSAT